MEPKAPDAPSPSERTVASGWRVLLSCMAVVTMFAALSFGAVVRDRVDLQSGPSASEPLAGLVASRQRDAGGIDLDAYYDAVEKILKAEYVEPIGDEQKLAVGAVHGMVASLGDPRSQFMDHDAFFEYQQAQEGKFTGIGADFYLQPTPVNLLAGDALPTDTDPTSDFEATRIPRLVVSSVIPGGPAERAGVRAGDWVDTVDGHWVIDAELIARYRALALANAQGKASKAQDELAREIRDRAEGAIMPLRAFTLLSLGSSGTVTVTWNRSGAPPRKVQIQKASVVDPGNVVSNGVIKLRFGKDAPEFLRSAINGHGAVTIDLRGQPEGYFDAMVTCLKTVAPSGSYGFFATHRKGEHPSPFVLTGGAAASPKMTLLVDHSVRGAAAIFALALSSHRLAKLQGTEVSEDHAKVLVEGLPDGSGYTMVTAEYQPFAAARPVGVKS